MTAPPGAHGRHLPSASVVIVADYKAGDDDSWDELRQTLEGLARQDSDVPVEFLLVEAEESRLEIPHDLARLLPALRVVRAQGRTSYDLKNAGARAARAPFVVMLDADCAPHPRWLRSVLEHRRRHPEAAAISGRTLYKGEGLLRRIFALLDRSYVESGKDGSTRAISNNNGGFDRDVLIRFPLRNDVGPFGSRPHSDAILAAGGTLRFEPDMVAYHGYGGWEMVREVRRHTGFSRARYRQINPEATHSWMFRLGSPGIPIIVGIAIADSCRRCVTLGSRYGIRCFEWPLAWAVAIRAHLMEIPGLLLAMRGGSIGADAYR
jgi:hypothetical protein